MERSELVALLLALAVYIWHNRRKIKKGIKDLKPPPEEKKEPPKKEEPKDPFI